MGLWSLSKSIRTEYRGRIWEISLYTAVGTSGNVKISLLVNNFTKTNVNNNKEISNASFNNKEY